MAEVSMTDIVTVMLAGWPVWRVAATSFLLSPPPPPMPPRCLDAQVYSGGLCFTCASAGSGVRPTVLVAEHGNNRVQEVDVVKGTHVGYLGPDGGLLGPFAVAASPTLIAVSSWKGCVVAVNKKKRSKLGLESLRPLPPTPHTQNRRVTLCVCVSPHSCLPVTLRCTQCATPSG